MANSKEAATYVSDIGDLEISMSIRRHFQHASGRCITGTIPSAGAIAS